ncbi:Probable LRR receptor-like serine/threonine-protein kinase At4g36180 [Linum perenne]
MPGEACSEIAFRFRHRRSSSARSPPLRRFVQKPLSLLLVGVSTGIVRHLEPYARSQSRSAAGGGGLVVMADSGGGQVVMAGGDSMFVSVRELRLPQIQLAGRLTPQLGELRQLPKLSLHSNNFNGSIPHSLSQCSLLRAVYLQHNSLSGDLPLSLLNLSNLQVFTVASNFLSGRIPSGFSVSLRFLDLSSNSLSGELSSNFSSDSQLQLLNLSFNNFSGEVLLSVEDNALRGLIPATIGSIPNLQVLSLSRNELSSSISSSIFCNVRANISAGLRILELGFDPARDEFLTTVGMRNGVGERKACRRRCRPELLAMGNGHRRLQTSGTGGRGCLLSSVWVSMEKV